jgi:hypothetical protein
MSTGIYALSDQYISTVADSLPGRCNRAHLHKYLDIRRMKMPDYLRVGALRGVRIRGEEPDRRWLVLEKHWERSVGKVRSRWVAGDEAHANGERILDYASFLQEAASKHQFVLERLDLWALSPEVKSSRDES